MQHEYTDILKVFEGLRCPELNNESIHFSVLLNKKKPNFTSLIEIQLWILGPTPAIQSIKFWSLVHIFPL